MVMIMDPRVHLVDDKYSIRDLIDINHLREMFEQFSLATGFTTGFLEYPSQQILIATGWRDICTKFHRFCPESAKHCKESNIYLSDRLRQLHELNVKPCKNGLVDGATPIVVKGRYIAYIATGQVLFEEPDIERFRRQAQKYGYDTGTYLEALNKVPIVTEKQFKYALSFLSNIAVTIADNALTNLKYQEKNTILEDEIEAHKQSQNALRENEKKYRSLTNNINVGIYRNTPGSEGKFVEANPAIAAMFGFESREEFLKVRVNNLYRYPNERKVFNDKLIKKGSVRNQELELQKKDGTIFIGSVSAVAVKNENGDIKYNDGIIEDISNRKQSELALQNSQLELDTIFSSAPLAMVLVDRDRRVRKMNTAAVKLTRRAQEESIGKRGGEALRCIHAYNDPKGCGFSQACESCIIRNTVLDTFSTGRNHQSVEAPIPYDTEKGVVDLWVLVSTTLLKFPQDEMVLVCIENITEQKQAKEELTSSEQRFRELAELLPQTVFEMDFDGRLLFVNKVAFKMFGYTLEDFNLGLNGFNMIIPEDHDKAQTTIEQLLGGERTISGEQYTALRKDGSTFPTIIYTSIIHKENRGTGLRGIIVDISDQISLKKEKERLEQQYFHAQKMEAIGRLAGGVAHDFNNILSAILGYTELTLMEHSLEASIKNKLESIQSSGLRARDLVNQILTISRKEDHVRAPINLDVIVRDTLKLLRPAIPTTIEIQTHISSNCCILGDPSRVHQIIMNLCTNAYQAMSETSGNLKIVLTQANLIGEAAERLEVPDGMYGKLLISDTGPGILPEIVDRIFEPYFTTKAQGKGTGLGLAAVHGIVKSHGGAIVVKSQIGQGTTFEVYLPLTKKERDKEKKATSQLPGGNERILLIDDEPDILIVEKEMLEKLGYKLKVACNARDALKQLIEQPDQFDLIITDITMPGMTGVEFIERLRKTYCEIPIILCTGFSELISEEKALSLGVNGFLKKPISMVDFSNTIRKVLDKKLN